MNKIPKLARGGIVVPIKIDTEYIDQKIQGIFMTQQEMLGKIEKQKKIIDHLSRVIQNKNKKYKQLQAKKIPPTMYGREVVIVPDSIANKIMIVNKDIFKCGS